MSIDKSSVHRAIRSLIEKEYVVRVRDEHDKRAYRVSLTKKARAIQIRLKK
ncbi:winged helix DNA-binding protein [Lactococcus cremoris]